MSCSLGLKPFERLERLERFERLLFSGDRQLVRSLAESPSALLRHHHRVAVDVDPYQLL